MDVLNYGSPELPVELPEGSAEAMDVPALPIELPQRSVEAMDLPELPIELPQGYDYVIDSYTALGVSGVLKFQSDFRVNISCQERASQWLKEFSKIACVSIKKPRGGSAKSYANSTLFSFKQKWVCQHAGSFTSTETKENKHGRETRQKCCNCPMNITIGIRHSSHWKNRVYTDHDKFPLFVNLYFDHNHNHFSARSLSHNGITEQAESDIIQLFKRGMGPTQAYNDLRATIAEHAHTKSRSYGGRDIEAVLADSSICPTLRQVKCIFYKYNNNNNEIFHASLYTH
mmetsp:Transcript_2316/g.3541  ORF Transcript_2316/g.3541 Transcript_2316/m.3541 type:complete len:286 (-) Transcript_2316:36-893(-)